MIEKMPGSMASLLLAATTSLFAVAGPARAQSASPPPTAIALGPSDPVRGAAVVERALKALGGAEVVDGVETLELHGRSTRLLPNGAELQVETASYMIPPDRYRQDSKVAETTVATLINPDGAFMIMGGQALPMPPAEAAAFRAAARRNVVTLLRARRTAGQQKVWIGTAKLGDATAQLVNVGSTADPTTLYIDDKDGRILRMSYGTPVAGAIQEITVDYADHRPVTGGLVYPFSATGRVAEKPAFRSAVTRIVVNGKLDEGLFAAAPAAPPSSSPKASPRTP